jgi:hypothetical protein
VIKENGIPVFSSDDRYVENYKKIAHDHVAAMNQTGHNPFIEEKLWVELENSTKNLVNKYVADDAKVLDAGVGLGTGANVDAGNVEPALSFNFSCVRP